MSKFSELGAVRVWMRGDDSAFTLHPRHFNEIRAAWMRGDCFFDAQDLFGDPVTVNLRNVVVIGLATPAAIAEADDEKRDEDLVGA